MKHQIFNIHYNFMQEYFRESARLLPLVYPGTRTFNLDGEDSFMKLVELLDKLEDKKFLYREGDIAVEELVKTLNATEDVSHIPGVDSFANIILSMYYFYQSGKKVYKFNPDFLFMLLRSKLGEVSHDFVKLPHSIYIPLEKNLNIGAGEGVPVEGLYVTVLEKGQFNFTEEDNDFAPEDVEKIIYVTTVGDFKKEYEGNDSFYINIPIIPGNVMPQIKGRVEKSIEKKTLGIHNREGMIIIYSLIINIILYLNCENADIEAVCPRKKDISKIKKPAKREKAKKRNAKLFPYYNVGKNVMADIERESNNDSGSGSQSPKSNRPNINYQTVWWMNPGYIKQQHHGPGNTERKLIYIGPHTKSRDLSLLNKSEG